MKKTILLFLGLFAGVISAFAQMMPDSTYQVCAYWEVGDKYNYQVEESKYKVKNGTDTTDVERAAHLLTLEIVDATDSTYRVRVKTDDYQYTNKQKDALTEGLIQQYGNQPFEFETNEFGVFKRILISDEEVQALYPVLDVVVDQTANDQNMDAIARDALRKMMREMFTKERIIGTYEDEITPLLMFHGRRLNHDTEVEYDTEVPSILGEDVPIQMKGLIWVDQEWTDEYSIVIHNDLESGKEGMMPYLNAFVETMKSSLGENANEETLKEMQDIFKNGVITRTDSMVEEIHLDTGWPIYYEYEQNVFVKNGDSSQEQIQNKTVELILEDNDE